MTEDIRPHYRLEARKEAMVLVRTVYDLKAIMRYFRQSIVSRVLSPGCTKASRFRMMVFALHPLPITHPSSPQKT